MNWLGMIQKVNEKYKVAETMAILVYNSHSRTITRELFICIQSLCTYTQSKSGIKYWKQHVPTHFKTLKNSFKMMYTSITHLSHEQHFSKLSFLYRYWSINNYRHHMDNFKPYCTHRHLLYLRYSF